MITLFTTKEFKKAGYKDLLPLKCKHCNKTFYKAKRKIQCMKKSWLKIGHNGNYCSQKCHALHTGHRPVTTTCSNCGKQITIGYFKFNKHKYHFCSKQCLGIYTNKHFKHICRRSKLEKWIESQLDILYPDLQVLYNDRDTINAELDVYIPSLNIAFELNGIFHYEPIYGADNLKRVQTNDTRRFQACIERGIELCIIDSSGQKYFKEASSQKYLDIITNIINEKIKAPASTPGSFVASSCPYSNNNYGCESLVSKP